jgi:hypothetical protein
MVENYIDYNNKKNMEEIWKDILGYEGLYQVSNFGRVKSCEKIIPHFRGGTRLLPERIRKLAFDSYGYLVLDLYKNGIGKTYKVHRLVVLSFLNLVENKNQINHKNGIKYDNNLNNLEWCNNSENIIHAYQNNLMKPVINNEKCVLMYDKTSGEFIKEFKSISLASKEMKCRSSDIVSVLKNRQKSARNHIFKYKNI